MIDDIIWRLWNLSLSQTLKNNNMPTQGERQNFLWRPNDNSSTTRLRYDLEAEHWVKAFESSSCKSTTRKSSTSFSKNMAGLGLLFPAVFDLLSLLFTLFSNILKCIISLIKK